MKTQNSTVEILRDAITQSDYKKMPLFSRFLATAWDLAALMAKTAPDECLVIRGDGSVFRGKTNHVKFEKMTMLAEKVVGKHDNEVDNFSEEKISISKNWANAPSPAFKNSWDKAVRGHLYEGDTTEPIFNMFVLKLQEVMEADPTCKDLTMHTVISPTRLSYHEIFIKGFPWSVAVGDKTSKFLYYRENGGEEVWC